METVVLRKYNESWIKIEADSIILQAISDHFVFLAENYRFHPAYKSGSWDGKIRLYNIAKNLFPIGLIFKLHVWLERQKFSVEYINFDPSNTMATDKQIIDFSNDKLKFPFPLRDYQVSAIKTCLCERKCVILSPTASGKSAIIYTALRMILHRNRAFKALIIVPTISLVDQMVGDFDDYSVKMKNSFGESCQRIFGGRDKEIKKNVAVSTWQSLMNLPIEFFHQFDVLMVDECHGGATEGKTVKRIVEQCRRAKYKIGLSGTLQESKLHQFSVMGLYGKIFQLTQTSREIERGNLSDLLIHQITLRYSEDESEQLYNHRNVLRSLANDESHSGAAVYQAEVKFINELPYKRNLIESICRKKTNNVLILYRRNSQFGFKLFDQLKKNLPSRKVFLITGATPADMRNEVRAICEKCNDAIIVANYGVFSTGVSIKNLHHIIFGESIKSKITTLQSIGRALRLHLSKEKAELYDIIDLLEHKGKKNLIGKHAESRMEIYEKEGFKVKNWETKTTDFIRENQS